MSNVLVNQKKVKVYGCHFHWFRQEQHKKKTSKGNDQLGLSYCESRDSRVKFHTSKSIYCDWDKILEIPFPSHTNSILQCRIICRQSLSQRHFFKRLSKYCTQKQKSSYSAVYICFAFSCCRLLLLSWEISITNKHVEKKKERS